MKENDWIAANISNPDFNTEDFILSGLNLDNTQLLSADKYKQSKYIQDNFDQGTNAFDDYYKKSATSFGQLQALNNNNTFLYDPFDTRATETSQFRSPDFNVTIVPNTTNDRNIFGNIFQGEESIRELAQDSQIKDTSTGEWKDITPNDTSLFSHPLEWFKSIFSDPLVYAKYEEDGEHYDPFTGQTVQHTKGQYKLNEFGKPYTETLNGRSLIGKDVVSKTDLISVDGEGINKYDFFDSDSLNKSVTGTVFKTAAAIAPMFLGPIGAGIYSGVLVGRELLKTLPMLYGQISSWLNLPEESSTLNTLAAFGESLTTSTSDEGNSSILNTEQVFNLLSDVALQWGQQKVIAQSINKLRGTDKLMQEAYGRAALDYKLQSKLLSEKVKTGEITEATFNKYIGSEDWTKSIIGSQAISKYTEDVEKLVQSSRRLGANTALAYMALVSNTDVYESMLEAGASRKEAAAVTLGSTLGMFSVDRYLHLGELFFDDLTAASTNQIRRTFAKEAKSWRDIIDPQELANQPTKNRFKRLIKAGVDFGRKTTNKYLDDLKYHTTGFFGKAFGEGIEEVAEEVTTDISKSLYELAGELGFNTQAKDVGAWDNMAARYGMSFLGGTLGGGLFYGVDVYQNGKFSIDQTQDELIYLVRNGKTEEVLKTLDQWKKQGKFGNTNLSTVTTTDSNGNKVFLTANEDQESQNDFIYNRIRETVLQLDDIINEYNANLSEDDLYNNMILSEARFRDLKDYLQDQSYTTGYQKDYQDILNKVINKRSELERASQTISGRSIQNEEEFKKNILTDELERRLTDDERSLREKNLKQLRDELAQYEEELNNFLSGKYSLEYTEKMLFGIDKYLRGDWTAMTYSEWLKKNHNKEISELTTAEATDYKNKYLEYKKSAQEQDLQRQFEIYKHIQKKINPILLNIQSNSRNFKKFQEEIKKLHSEDSPIFKFKYYTEEDILDFDGETKDSDSYINRNNPEVRAERLSKIQSENNRQLEERKNSILKIIDDSGGFIDPITRRDLQLLLRTRNKDIQESIIKSISYLIDKDNIIINPETQEVLQGIQSDVDQNFLKLLHKYNGSNRDEILSDIQAMLRKSYQQKGSEETDIIQAVIEYLNPSDAQELFQAEDIAISDIGIKSEEILPLSEEEITSSYRVNPVKFNALLQVIKTKLEHNESNYRLPIDLRAWLDSNDDYKKDLDYYNRMFARFIDAVNSNSDIQLNQELDKRVSNINPILDLIKSLGLELNINMNNIESLLSKLGSNFEEIDSLDDLILSSEEKESFDEAEFLIKLLKSHLYAASARPNLVNPYGHNYTINEFAKNHPDIYPDFEELAVLPVDVAASYEQELNKYLLQMGIFNEKTQSYNPNSFRALSMENESNKIKQLLRAEKAWNKTLYDLFANNRDFFKFKYNNEEIDLLEGFDTIPQIAKDTKNALLYLNQLFDLFHNNIQRLRNNGWSYSQIWERSNLLKNISNLDQVMEQKVCSLDDKVTVDKLTDYDKVCILNVIAAMPSSDFYKYLKSRIEEEHNIVPLTIQEWVSRVGIAFVNNPQIFNETAQYLVRETKSKKPILFNGLFIGGDAGSGKSSVIAKNIAKNISSNNIWLSAPTTEQANNLFNAVTKGIQMLNSESLPDSSQSLFSRMKIDLKALTEAKSLLDSDQVKANDYFTVTETEESYLLNINFEKFNIKKVSDAPSLIIIDEATHLSNLELQLISKFAEINDVELILLGDTKQNGFSGIGQNVDRESCFVWRSPELGISLRDNNAQHFFNLNSLKSLIFQLSNLTKTEESLTKYSLAINQIKSSLSNIRFKVYNQDVLQGDLIVDNLTDEQIKKLSGTVAYIGRTDSSTLTKLQNSNLDVKVFNSKNIQGQEFDYVVIDKNFDINLSSDLNLVNFLRDLYTMISRGKVGSIIVDSSNKLRSTIGQNRVELAKARTVNIADYAQQFREEKLEQLNNISTKPQEKPSNKVESSEEPEQENEEIPTIVTDSEFHVSDIDFKNNYVVIHQTQTKWITSIANTGLKSIAGLEGTALFANAESLQQIIDLQREGRGHNHSTAIVIMIFPRSEFNKKERYSLDDISDQISDYPGGSISLIPPKYIKYIVDVKPTIQQEQIKTDESDAEQPPVQNQQILSEMSMSKDAIPTEDTIPDDPILCFGNAILHGFKVEQRDGKEVWINDGTTNRDGQLFAEKGEVTDQQELINTLREFRNSFLYNHSYEDLSNKITSRIPKSVYENIKWSIEVRPVNDYDNFIRLSGYKRDELAFGNKHLMYSVIGTLTFPDGSTGTITLGLLRNPKKWIDGVPAKLDQYNNKLKRLKEDYTKTTSSTKKNFIQKQIDRINQNIESINLSNPKSKIRQYDRYISELEQMSDGTNPILVPIKSIITPSVTNLFNTGRVLRLSRIKDELIKNTQTMINDLIQKINTLNPAVDGFEELAEQLNLRLQALQKKLKQYQSIKEGSFLSLNHNTIVSPMYIYAPDKHVKDTSGIDDSVMGRYNVVFVTNDNSLNADELADIYIRQKQIAAQIAAGENVKDLTPRVRMVVLNNLGVSFQDLSNPFLQETMTTTVNQKGGGTITQIYPFKTHFTGVRMYVGLWNFRANLLQFNDAFTKFKETLPIDLNQLDIYLGIKDILWRQNNKATLSQQEINFLNKHKNLDKFNEVCKLIDDFNDSLSSKVKQFRLGNRLGVGAYIRNLTGDTKALYKTDDKVKGIYLNYSTLQKYLNLANSLFNNVLNNIITCDLDSRKWLSTQEGVRNSFANHITTLGNKNGVIDIVGENQAINFGSAYDPTGSQGILNVFSHIPAVLSKVFKYTLMKQSNRTTKDFKDRYKIVVKWTDESKQDHSKALPYHLIWSELNMDSFDRSLSDFFSFAFHGTLQDVQSEDAIRATDALFPKGFFSDPLSSLEQVTSGGHRWFIKSVQNPVFFGADVMVGDPTFFITLKDIQEGIEEIKNPASIQRTITLDSITWKDNPELNNIIENLQDETEDGDITSEEDLNQRATQLLKDYIKDIQKTIFSGNSISLSASSIISLDQTNNPQSIKQILDKFVQDTINKESISNISSIQYRNNSLLITADDYVFEITKLNSNLNIRIISSPNIVTNNTSKEAIDDIQNILNTLEKISANEDLELEESPTYKSIQQQTKKLSETTTDNQANSYIRTIKQKFNTLLEELFNDNTLESEDGITVSDVLKLINTFNNKHKDCQ